MDPDKRSSPDEGSFAEAIRDLADEKRRELGEHPTAEVLVVFGEKRLSAAEDEEVRDHLVLCPECRELLRDLGGFGAEPAGSPELADVDVEVAWQGLRARLGEGAAATEVPFPSHRAARRQLAGEERTAGRVAVLEPRRRGSGWGLDRNRFALAASLLLAVAGLAWGGYQWSRARTASGPQGDVLLVPLFAEVSRGGSQEGLVPAGVERFMLAITPPEARGSGEYEIAVVQGEAVLLTESLEDQGDGTLTIVLTRDLLPTGDYQVRLYDRAPGRRHVADYSFRVEGSRAGR